MTAARAHRRQGRRRAAAVAALLLGPLAIASAAVFVGEDPWQAVSMLLSLALALAAGWFGLAPRRHADRRPRSRRATACRTPASRRGRAATSRSTSGSTATTSSAPSTRSSTGASVVDLAEVNGRVFVNNVSLGLYATALQRDGYRAAKLRTVLRTLPDVAGPGSAARDLEYGHADGRAPQGGMILLVSNNRYRLGGVMGSGTRPRIDDGRLGVAVVRSRRKRRAPSPRLWHEWDAREFEVRSSAGVPAGIDGEAAVLAAPLRFKSLPGALRVRVAASHPGASPSAAQPDSVRQGIRSLVAIAAGRGAP